MAERDWGPTLLGNDHVWHKLNPPGASGYNFCFSLFWVFTCLSLSSTVQEQPSLGHLITIDKIFLPVALSGNTCYSIIRKKIKRSAQDQSNMNFFDSKGSFLFISSVNVWLERMRPLCRWWWWLLWLLFEDGFYWNCLNTLKVNLALPWIKNVNEWIKLSCSKSFKKFLDSSLGFTFLPCFILRVSVK